MPQRLRFAGRGYAYHVLNRAVERTPIFAKERDFEAFEEVIAQAKTRLPMRVLAWCVMSNHWHFVLWWFHGHRTQRLTAAAVLID